MVDILIVEDNIDKLREIVKEVLSVDGITENNIYEALDVFSAKKILKEKKFTLLILDINLPKKKGEHPEKLSGLDVLGFINNNRRSIPPTYIVGMTAYDEVFNDAQEQFSSLIWKVIKFSFDNLEWRTHLNSTLKFLIENDIPPYKNDGKTHHIDVGVVCALEEELNAVLDLDLGWEKQEVKYDHSRYHKATIELEEQVICIVAVAAPNMGMTPSAVIAQKIISNFRPRMLVMTGICAGIRKKTDIGDILIADPCFEWGGGKWLSDDSGSLTFKAAPYQWRIDESIRAALRDVASEPNLMNEIYSNYKGKRPCNKPKVMIEAMASGSSVLQSTKMLKDIIEQHKNLIGVEMESYAVFTAAELAESPKPICVTLKSVCDFGDEEKTDGYHNYACYTSAQLFLHFIQRWFDIN